MRLFPVFLSLCILILGLSGCVSMRSGTSTGALGLEPSAMLRFSDVPHPAGFKLLADKSFILESGGMRAGILKYVGKADPESVVLFYKNQMPIYNWALLNILEYGERMLNFERENEGCVVTIKSKGKRVEVTVSLAPKSPIPMSVKKIEKKEAVETYQGK
jgi:hypothetical protein